MHSPEVLAAIARLTFDYATGVDNRDWALFRSVFTDQCNIDFSSWSGAPAATMSSDVWTQAMRSVTGAFDATQHLMANHRVLAGNHGLLPDVVVASNEVQAQHWFSAESMASFKRPAEPAWCTVGGVFTNHYVLVDDAWRVAACRLTVRWRTGDESLFSLARERH